MSYMHRTMIVTALQAPRARQLCEQLAGPPGAGMFATPLSPLGMLPATHYISAGMIEDGMAAVLASPAAMKAACQAAGISITLLECTTLLDMSSVTAEPAQDAMARMGLRMISVGATP